MSEYNNLKARVREKRRVHRKPQCSQTVLGQHSSCNQVLWFYIDVPMRFGRPDFLLLEEIRRGYNTVARSSENEYVIPVNSYITESQVPHASPIIKLVA